jgi:UDP-N-acetylglucosamine--N-acetylmuramyl-(pentapeptide) pyrophosphoryl-undecaprenol N-acetylglucosamine transferase
MTFLLTGTHITPAVALIQEIRRRHPQAKVIYVGRSDFSGGKVNVEKMEIERMGTIFKPISFGKLNRFFSLSLLKEIFKIPIGFIQAGQIICREKPDAVISFGGYISVPIILMSWLAKIPILVHEQTTVMGLANKIASPFATTVAVSWQNLASKGRVLTGNPLPEEILGVKKRLRPGKEVLLITGGSQGSETIDKAVAAILPELVRHFEIYHQTSRKKFFVANVPQNGRLDYHSARWFSTPQFAEISGKTSIAVSRSGANVVCYLAYLGIPAILIPLPYSGGGEQMKNALMLVETGLAKILPQTALSPAKLLAEILEMKKNRRQIIAKSAALAKKLVNPDAAAKLMDLVDKVL